MAKHFFQQRLAFVLNGTDCDDTDNTVLSSALDGDCDGVETIDDCDDNDATDTALSGDCDQDGVLTADDCDDFDASTVNDMDCDGSLTADDCDDNNPNAYPGAGFNESDPTLCVEDADGDGYGSMNNSSVSSCVKFNMVDSYGDGWTGNAIEILEDGIVTASYANDSSYAAYDVHSETHCFANATTAVKFVYVQGSFSSDISFWVEDPTTGVSYGSGMGTGVSQGIVLGGKPIHRWSNFLFWIEKWDENGTDCDDTDTASFTTADDPDCDGVLN